MLGALLLLLLLASPAAAHRVRLFAWAEGDRILGETEFSGGRPAQRAPVQVLTADGRELLRVETDDAGHFAFAIPAEARQQRINLRLVLEGGAGHRAEWPLSAADYLGGQPAAVAEPATAPGTPASSSPDEARLAQLVEQAVERQLGPLRRQLAKDQQAQRLQDIIGGIGYLLGLAGLVAWFRSRR
jgi:nickel transport protein